MAKDTAATEYPTVSYGSFTSALDKFAESGGAPNEIHPSAFDKKAFNGSTIALLVKAFRTLGLSNDKNEPIPERIDPLIDSKTRKDAFGKLLRERYETLIALPLERATSKQFNDWFEQSGMAAENQRKAKTFFLHAARANGIVVSTFILAKSNTRTPPKRDRRRQQKPPNGDANNGKGGSGNGQETSTTIAAKILAKFPDFDPEWAPETQQKWFEGIASLHKVLEKTEGSDE